MLKDVYKDEYTLEELPMGHVRLAMQVELEYFCDKVWVGVPLHVAQKDPDGKNIRSIWVNSNKNDISTSNGTATNSKSAVRVVSASRWNSGGVFVVVGIPSRHNPNGKEEIDHSVE